MRRILAIVDDDLRYGESLAAYLNSCGKCIFRAYAYPSPEAFRKEAGEYDVRILLMAEGFAEAFRRQELPPASLVFSEDGLAESSHGLRAVCKYKSADRILQDVLRFYTEDDMDRLSRAVSEKSRITGIFSPAGRCGKTSLAITLGLILAGKGKTLLLSLDGYAGAFRHISAEAVSDLSDVIYGFRNDRYSWSLLAQSVYSFGPLDYVPPVRYYEDLMQMKPSAMSEMMMRIADESGYEHIVIDIGSYGCMSAETAEICDRLILPDPGDDISGCKIEEYLESLEMSGREELRKKVERVRLPFIEKTAEELVSPESYLEGELFEAAEALAARSLRGRGEPAARNRRGYV